MNVKQLEFAATGTKKFFVVLVVHLQVLFVVCVTSGYCWVTYILTTVCARGDRVKTKMQTRHANLVRARCRRAHWQDMVSYSSMKPCPFQLHMPIQASAVDKPRSKLRRTHNAQQHANPRTIQPRHTRATSGPPHPHLELAEYSCAPTGRGRPWVEKFFFPPPRRKKNF